MNSTTLVILKKNNDNFIIYFAVVYFSVKLYHQQINAAYNMQLYLRFLVKYHVLLST